MKPLQAAADAPIEISVRVRSDEAAVFVLTNHEHRLLAPPLLLDRIAGDAVSRRTVVSRQTLRLFGPGLSSVVFAGPQQELTRWLESTRSAAPAMVDDLQLQAAKNGFRSTRIELAEAQTPATQAPLALEQLQRRMETGDPESALRDLETQLRVAPAPVLPEIHALASEAAFAFGRVALARQHASLGLSLQPPLTAALEARLLRALLVAESEGGLAERESAARQRLQALSDARTDPLEAALDAQSELRFAMVHDRAYSDELAPAAARRLIAAAAALDEARIGPVAAMLCAAGMLLPEDARAARLFGAAERAAARDGLVAAQAHCAIARGDAARERQPSPDAESHYMRAIELLAERHLPREQREAWYSAAVAASERGDVHEAFVRATRAAHWLDRLVAYETDLGAREALLINTGSYYAHAVAWGVQAGEVEAALTLAETSKGRAMQALLRGPAELQESAFGAWMPGVDTRAQDANVLARLRSQLTTRDLVLSYVVLRTDPGYQVVIGAIARDGVTAKLVDAGSDLSLNVVALARAVADNDAQSTRVHGTQLYETLLRPMTPQLVGRERLFISANLRLHALPWPALHDGDSWLVERFALARVPPLSGLSPAAEHCGAPTPRRWVAVLDPAHPGLPMLPGLIPALSPTLQATLQPLATLQLEAATPERARASLHQANALFYAGHASFDAARPLRSALLLAPSQNTAEDRIEAFELLTHAHCLDLIVLLGCETARAYSPEHAFSDDALGLSRAFLAGGARHVIGSLWPIIDRDAEDFGRVLAQHLSAEVMQDLQRTQACLSSGRCASRGVAAWGGYLLDTQLPDTHEQAFDAVRNRPSHASEKMTGPSRSF